MINTKVNLPNIGQDELEITEIMVKIGDFIKINQAVIVVEGDKSSMDIPSPHSGIVTNIHIQIGDKVHTGSLILSLNISDKAQSISSDDQQKNILNINTDSKLSKFFLEKKNIIHNQKHNDHPKIKSDIHYLTHASPSIRHMARQLGIDLTQITGSGRKGRILKEDIQNYIDHKSKNSNQPVQNETISSLVRDAFPSYHKTNLNQFDDHKKTMLSKIQKISGTNLLRNWITIPHVTQFDMVDVTELEAFRKQQNIEIKKQKLDFKITLLVFIIKAVSKALEQLPRFNSSLSQDGASIILKKYINIGIAVDTTAGVLVPVLRNINKKGIITLSEELSKTVQKIRLKNQLNTFNIQDSSFTISNLGNIGGTAFTPIVNFPEVAILGISKTRIQPVWNEEKFVPRLMLPLSLSYDHRVIDGADGARFITLINKIISDIRLLSM